MRGVVYGSICSELAGFDVEVSANGLILGSTSPAPARELDRLNFAMRVPATLLLEAPVSLRVRVKGISEPAEAELLYTTEEQVVRAFTLADGAVAMRAGEIVGTLNHVNPDALPLKVVAYCGDRLIGSQIFHKDIPQSDGLITSIPLKLQIPADVLDGTPHSISIRVEDGPHLEGSPFVISVLSGHDLAHRLGSLERLAAKLTDDVDTMQTKIVDQLADQLQSVIIPRIDAIVGLQRASLERQLAAMWRMLPDNGFERIGPPLPLTATFLPGEPFIGFGWSDNFPNSTGGRWLGRSAHLALQLSDRDDAVLIVHGAGSSTPEALESASVEVNGNLVSLTRIDDSSTDTWKLIGTVNRASMRPGGALDLRIRSESTDVDTTARRNAISLSISRIDIISAAALRHADEALSDAQCLSGFYDPEETAAGERFRWMSGFGLASVFVGTRQRARIRVGGPMMLKPSAAKLLEITVIGADAQTGPVIANESGWHVELSLGNVRDGVAVLAFSTEAHHPRNGDARLLSLAVSHIEVLG
ncbi:hypothetical protein HL653_07305 [Sphingomonas sp. AP4-R1]|uniref:hypothetical protein n=1 Tax=Sphingomonas sp. AP4-R1 TaxID=2735134 RepID=UPI0014939A9B|nr:hypothetical protein [Sphingomonas sp. AP4-R1]QJU57621.1 hypothetical protein HL653_07305 [Sphingomonas sp. AP4-R1]